MNSVDGVTGQLIEAIRTSTVYEEYLRQLERVKQQPELKAQVDEYRARNYQLQTGGQVDFDKIDRFEREYEQLRENPCVADFLAAELAFCRMMQDINNQITEALQFD